MAFPNQHLPGQLVHSIRRTCEGIYWFSPNPDCVRGMAYTYGLGVEASRVMPHVEVTMSNHRQGVFTCLTGKRSRFHQKHHGIFAEQYNGHLGRCGYMWDHRGPTQPVLLPGPTDEFCFAHGEGEQEAKIWKSRWDALGLGCVDRTILYDLMNPVSANLVQHFRTFPGFKIGPDDWGKWAVNERPDWVASGYPDFSAFMALPPPEWWDRAELVDCGDTRIVVVPEILHEFEERRKWAKQNRPKVSARLDPAAFELFISAENLERARAHYLELMDVLEKEFAKDRAAAGKRVVGRRNLLKQEVGYRPPSPDIVYGTSRYKPRFTGSTTAVKTATLAYRSWLKNYWRALGRFNANRDFNVVFPAGTVRMAEIASVRCRGRPLPEENPMRR